MFNSSLIAQDVKVINNGQFGGDIAEMVLFLVFITFFVTRLDVVSISRHDHTNCDQVFLVIKIYSLILSSQWFISNDVEYSD